MRSHDVDLLARELFQMLASLAVAPRSSSDDTLRSERRTEKSCNLLADRKVVGLMPSEATPPSSAM